MTKDKTVTMLRELIEHLAAYASDSASAVMRARAVEVRKILAAPVVERQEDRLPCDVRLPPSTTIRKGNTVESLMRCIKLREGRPDCDRRFNEEMAEPMISLSDHKKGLAAYADHIEMLKKQLASPPAPAPVAYTTPGMLEIAKRIPLTGRIGAKVTKDERWNVPLYTSPPAPVAVDDSTTSDKYRAELYDEVWQKARDMGFANVTDALERLDDIDGCPRLDKVKEMNR